MATIEITPDHVEVCLTRNEKIFAVRRHRVRVERSAVTSVKVVEDPMSMTKGLRAPGLHWPGRSGAKYGTWRAPGRRQFVAARAGQRGVVIELYKERYDALVVGTEDPEGVVASLATDTEA